MHTSSLNRIFKFSRKYDFFKLLASEKESHKRNTPYFVGVTAKQSMARSATLMIKSFRAQNNIQIMFFIEPLEEFEMVEAKKTILKINIFLEAGKNPKGKMSVE